MLEAFFGILVILTDLGLNCVPSSFINTQFSKFKCFRSSLFDVTSWKYCAIAYSKCLNLCKTIWQFHYGITLISSLVQSSNEILISGDLLFYFFFLFSFHISNQSQHLIITHTHNSIQIALYRTVSLFVRKFRMD